ncbi:MAG: dihydrolipoyl dehydrogenase [Proteobacteria bacterium]|nr:dihydrolipoyl dehydrogenase [Pseudomonadota bacterium]
MTTENSTKLLVIGGGPGGYVAAIRAGQLGIPTTLVEGQSLGGTCLNIGCIPSKALIHAADAYDLAQRQSGAKGHLGIHVQAPRLELAETLKWKDGIVGKLTGGVGALLKKAGVQVVQGWAEIVDGKTVDVKRDDGSVQRLSCEHLLLAHGSVPVELPMLPFGGMDGAVISSTEALSLKAVPQHLVVVGAGYIGLELGTAWRKLGAAVTVVEARERVLPAYDDELTKPVARSLAKLGVRVLLNTQVTGPMDGAPGIRVRDASGKDADLAADVVLVAVGRKPRSAGLASLQLAMKGKAVQVDEQCRTSMRNVWAIGDLTGEPMLAHRGMAQGEMVAEVIAGHTRRFEPASIPAVCFTDPEVVAVGAAPGEVDAATHVTAMFPLSANGRAMTLDGTDGFIRVVARKDDHLIVGWQAVGHGVSELTSTFGHSIAMCERLEDTAGTIHAHPTLGEAVQEAALRALGHALHI